MIEQVKVAFRSLCSFLYLHIQLYNQCAVRRRPFAKSKKHQTKVAGYSRLWIFIFYFGSKIRGLGGNLLQIRQNDKLRKKTLIRLGPYEQIELCHVEFRKKNVKDKKVLCFFLQCAVMS